MSFQGETYKDVGFSEITEAGGEGAGSEPPPFPSASAGLRHSGPSAFVFAVRDVKLCEQLIAHWKHQ